MLVALDFDGVICDSVQECMLTAFNAYHRFERHTVYANDVSEIDSDFIARFGRSRYFVRPAKEYWLLAHFIYTESGDLDQARFDNLKLQYADVLDDFDSVFFEVRRNMQKSEPDRWAALHRIFPEFLEGWDRVRFNCPVHVITTKDLESVEYLIRLWRLELLPDNLWTKDHQYSKTSAVQRITEVTGYPVEDILFVDDQLDHLRDVSATGAKCYWAKWGYTPLSAVSPDYDFPHLKTLSELPL